MAAKKPNKKPVCPYCGRKMVQQFIGLKHCKCGMSWKKGTGYFERTQDMAFILLRQTVKKGKNAVKTKQVPSIRYLDNDKDAQFTGKERSGEP